MKHSFYLGGYITLLAIFLSARPCSGQSAKPNILFIAVDDLNDWTTLFSPSNPIKTPHITALAQKGAFFTRAYAASPACNPSRASVLTGTRPHQTGIYGNKSDWRKALPDRETLQQFLMRRGYYSAGAGKIFHHHWDGAFHDTASFDDFLPMPDQYPDAPMPKHKRNGLEEYGSKNTDWGQWPASEKDAVDYKTASYAVNFLAHQQQAPFILSVGIFRPHMPFFAPEPYRRPYQEQPVVMPATKTNDWNDLPRGATTMLNPNRWFWEGMQQALLKDSSAWRELVRSYQAAASFADAQIGRVLEALSKSAYAKNTIIILWSDHGYHLGEKQHLEKFALWEKTTHVPMIIVAPGVTQPGMQIPNPVDLTTIYPTLLELCGFAREAKQSDGLSLVPLLRGQPQSLPPALMTYMKGNHALRTERWRLIHYADQTEELYDHFSDPSEWYNLAKDPRYIDVLKELRSYLPTRNAEPVEDMIRPARVVPTEYTKPLTRK